MAAPLAVNRPLWQVSIRTTAEAEEAVAELLFRLCSEPASSYADVETGVVLVSVYLQQRPTHLRTALRNGLARIKRCGLEPGPGEISIRRLAHQDWAESWKRHFKPIQIGPALLIRPGWSRRRARPGQAEVVLDPGLSFGTGQHPTTAFCLRQLVNCRSQAGRASILDIGTGSGILAIAAAKLGYAPVEAFDFDPDAVRVARANARRNRVHHKVRMHQSDLCRLPKRSRRHYDLVCANLISTLLVAERDRILARLKPGGRVILAGILRTEFLQVRRVYEKAGLKLVASLAEREWYSCAFRFV
jgi:ribosomal protein L11 methyltransferase